MGFVCCGGGVEGDADGLHVGVNDSLGGGVVEVGDRGVGEVLGPHEGYY